MDPFPNFIIIVISLLFSAYFGFARYALISTFKSGFEIDKHTQSIIAKLKNAIKANPEKYIATLTFGNYFFAVTGILAFAGLLIPFFGSYLLPISISYLIISLTVAIGIFIFGILILNTIYSIVPEKWIQFHLIPLTFFLLLFYPVFRFTLFITCILTNKKTKADRKNQLFGRIDLGWFEVEKDTASTEKKESIETEVKLFKNALDFSKVKLREIMVPRTEIEMLDVNSTFNELRQRFAETGYSRIIFYDGNIDNIVGYVHSSVIFKKPESFKPFINNVLIVPETMPANKLLSTFIKEHRSIAIVVDEFGGTSGMVTSEDILEEIFGEIEDEHDTIDIIEKKLSETEFILSGRSEIDLINEKYQINLPESEDFETLAGFILYHHESIPKINSAIKIGAFQFKILKATNTKIELVKLTIIL